MTKNNIVNMLRIMQEECSDTIVELYCDVCNRNGDVVHPDQSIFVSLSPDTRITMRHRIVDNAVATFNSIEEFRDYAVCSREDMERIGCGSYFANIAVCGSHRKTPINRFRSQYTELRNSIHKTLLRMRAYGVHSQYIDDTVLDIRECPRAKVLGLDEIVVSNNNLACIRPDDVKQFIIDYCVKIDDIITITDWLLDEYAPKD